MPAKAPTPQVFTSSPKPTRYHRGRHEDAEAPADSEHREETESPPANDDRR